MEAAQAGDRPRDSVIEFFCLSCGRKIRVAKTKAGQKGKCPGCGGVVRVPAPEAQKSEKDMGNLDESVFDISEVEELRLKREEELSDESYEKNETADEIEDNDQRKLPLIIDVLAYPTSKAGMFNLAIFIGVPILIDFLWKVLPVELGCLFTLISLVLELFIFIYMYWYFSECVRDSAEGGLRAPAHSWYVSDMVLQTANIFGSFFASFWPVIVYICLFKSADVIFWLLLLLGSFFFPMSLLAVVVFDSVRGLNPRLLFVSISNTFVQYIYLVLAILAVSILILIVGTQVKDSLYLTVILRSAAFYLAFVGAHLLGSFYWRNQEKLNWEV